MGAGILIDEIFHHPPEKPASDSVQKQALIHLGEYLALGGMPEVIQCWIEEKDPLECFKIQNAVIDMYRQDFNKYAKEYQLPQLDLLFKQLPIQLGRRFKYSEVSNNYRKRELEPCLNLLETAGIIHKVYHSSSRGIPIGHDTNFDKFKVVFLDIGLAQASLGRNSGQWLLQPMKEVRNKGEVTEAFVGQELIAYSEATQKHQLYYWHRESRGSQAEVDYVIQHQGHLAPIKIKDGKESTLKSMHMFMADREKTPYGYRFSSQNYSVYNKIKSYPLYAIFAMLNQLKD